MARRKPPARSQRFTRLARREKRYSMEYAARKRERIASKKYVEQAKKLAPYVPSLKESAKKTRLSAAEKARVTHYTKVLQHAPTLKKLTKKQAKRFKKQLYAPGVQAIGLRGISETAKIKPVGDDLILTQNGRTWIFWKLDRDTIRSKRKMQSSAQKAWDLQFPIEKLIALAEKAHKKFKVLGLRLWASSGAVGFTYDDLNSFVRYIEEHWQAGKYLGQTPDGDIRFSDPMKWVNGLAILISETGEVPRRVRIFTSTKSRADVSEMG